MQKQVDRLNAEMKEKNIQIQTLKLRYEKIQVELAGKIKGSNQSSIENQNLMSMIKKLQNQNAYLQETVDKHKRKFQPDYQRLKSQLEICLLEIKSQENDNKLLNSRIKDLINYNQHLKEQNRQLIQKSQKQEIEMLKVREVLQEAKAEIQKNTDEKIDSSEKRDAMLLENDQLRNQLATLHKQMEILKVSGQKQIILQEIGGLIGKRAKQEN